jgi:hypothetical protein
MAKQLSSFQPTSSTKLYSPLNGSSIDISGNGNHGTDSVISYVGGKFGQGASFNGSTSSISHGTSSSLNPANITISAWFNSSSISTLQAIVTRDEASAIGSDRCYSIYINASQLTCELFSSSTVVTIIGSTVLSSNTWYHVVATYDGANVKMYLKGVSDATPISTGISLFTAPINTVIGRRVSSLWFNGIIDEVIIENRAWTAQEVSTYYRKSMMTYKSSNLFSNFISYLLTADVRPYVLTGISNNLIKALRMLANIRTYTLTGIDALFARGKGMVADVASFVLTGRDAMLSKVIKMIATVGTFTLTGIAVSFKLGHILLSEVGSFLLSGKDIIIRFRGWTKTPKDSGEGWTRTPKD